jgi:hypothetical protein
VSDPFTDLRHVLRRRHDWLHAKLRRTTDPEQIRLLKARKTEIWEVWHDFLFEGPVPDHKRNPLPSAEESHS